MIFLSFFLICLACEGGIWLQEVERDYWHERQEADGFLASVWGIERAQLLPSDWFQVNQSDIFEMWLRLFEMWPQLYDSKGSWNVGDGRLFGKRMRNWEDTTAACSTMTQKDSSRTDLKAWLKGQFVSRIDRQLDSKAWLEETDSKGWLQKLIQN